MRLQTPFEAPRLPLNPSQVKVLVIDDHQPIRSAVTALLQEAGYDVRAAHDGQQGLDLLLDGEFRPRIILLDFLMPTMDGLTFIEALDRLPRADEIAVVCISHRKVPEALRQRASAVLEKPFDAEALLDSVARASAGPTRSRL